MARIVTSEGPTLMARAEAVVVDSLQGWGMVSALVGFASMAHAVRVVLDPRANLADPDALPLIGLMIAVPALVSGAVYLGIAFHVHVRAEPSRLTMSDAGLHVESHHGRAEVRWSAVERWSATPRTLVLKMKSGDLLVLPKRLLGDEGVRTLEGWLAAA